MASRRRSDLPELREFVKEHDQKLYDFCFYALSGGYNVERVVLDTFRDFGAQYRRVLGRTKKWDGELARTELFRIAWQKIRDETAHVEYSVVLGRDTREVQKFDDDLLAQWQRNPQMLGVFEEQFLERLSQVEFEFRVPVVLRDIIGFSDDEVMSILGLRWGVHRHRLNRGRLELLERLKGITTEHRPPEVTA